MEGLFQRIDEALRAAGFCPGSWQIAGIFTVSGTLLIDQISGEIFDSGGVVAVVDHQPHAEPLDTTSPHRIRGAMLIGFPQGIPELWILGSGWKEEPLG